MKIKRYKNGALLVLLSNVLCTLLCIEVYTVPSFLTGTLGTLDPYPDDKGSG